MTHGIQGLVAKLYRSAAASDVEGHPADGEWKRELARRFKKAAKTLKQSHCCATMQEPGICGGCYVSEALSEIEGSPE